MTFEKILQREVTEELGADFKFKLQGFLFPSRVYPFVKAEEFGIQGIMLLVFAADYVGGEIKLSNEHSEYFWFDITKQPITKEDFMYDDMGAGLRRYAEEVKRQPG